MSKKINVKFRKDEWFIPVHRGKPMDSMIAILIIEERDCTYEEYFKALGYLTKLGMVWNLQGFYGRLASEAIELEIMDNSGNIDWEKALVHKEVANV